MKNLLFIYNAHSGKGTIKTKLAEILDIMVKGGCRVMVHPTQEPNDAIRVVERESQNFDLLVCSGGDGTLDEVVTGMMHVRERKPIGYIPTGSTNDFATSLKIPKNVRKAAEIAVGGHIFPCDVGMLNDSVFIYVAAFGIFTEISYRTNQEMKNLFGHAAYILQGAKSIMEIEAYRMRVEYDDVVLEDDFIYGMVSNSVSVGGFKGIAGKNVKLDDGVFEVTLIKLPKNPLELNEIITALLTRINNTDLIYSFKTDRITFYAQKEVSWTVDGEYGGAYTQATVKNCCRSVAFVVEKAGTITL